MSSKCIDCANMATLKSGLVFKAVCRVVPGVISESVDSFVYPDVSSCSSYRVKGALKLESTSDIGKKRPDDGLMSMHDNT
jgi:hypothetical protein